jgi:hypothetical protein
MKYGKLSVFNQPMCLIRNDENETLTVVEDVLQEISTIDNTVYVIAIAIAIHTEPASLTYLISWQDANKASYVNLQITVQTETDELSYPQ